MNKDVMIKIAIAAFVVIIFIVAVMIFRHKKDNYEYPVGILYSPPATDPGANKKGNGGINIPAGTTVASLVVDQSGNINTVTPVPIGGIIMWAGSTASIPLGWGLCDGSTYTTFEIGQLVSPDLRGRFVLGAGTRDIRYGVGDVGGEEYHQLTIPEMPSHNHGLTPPGDWKLGNGGGSWPVGVPGGQNTGGDPANNNATLPHNNMPPYYALAYIIKYT